MADLIQTDESSGLRVAGIWLYALGFTDFPPPSPADPHARRPTKSTLRPRTAVLLAAVVAAAATTAMLFSPVPNSPSAPPPQPSTASALTPREFALPPPAPAAQQLWPTPRDRDALATDAESIRAAIEEVVLRLRDPTTRDVRTTEHLIQRSFDKAEQTRAFLLAFPCILGPVAKSVALPPATPPDEPSPMCATAEHTAQALWDVLHELEDEPRGNVVQLRARVRSLTLAALRTRANWIRDLVSSSGDLSNEDVARVLDIAHRLTDHPRRDSSPPDYLSDTSWQALDEFDTFVARARLVDAAATRLLRIADDCAAARCIEDALLPSPPDNLGNPPACNEDCGVRRAVQDHRDRVPGMLRTVMVERLPAIARRTGGRVDAVPAVSASASQERECAMQRANGLLARSVLNSASTLSERYGFTVLTPDEVAAAELASQRASIWIASRESLNGSVAVDQEDDDELVLRSFWAALDAAVQARPAPVPQEIEDRVQNGLLRIAAKIEDCADASRAALRAERILEVSLRRDRDRPLVADTKFTQRLTETCLILRAECGSQPRLPSPRELQDAHSRESDVRPMLDALSIVVGYGWSRNESLALDHRTIDELSRLPPKALGGALSRWRDRVRILALDASGGKPTGSQVRAMWAYSVIGPHVRASEIEQEFARGTSLAARALDDPRLVREAVTDLNRLVDRLAAPIRSEGEVGDPGVVRAFLARLKR